MSSSAEFVIGICVTLGFWLFIFLKNRNQGRKLPPGPRGLPILGFLPWIKPNAPHESLTELVRKYGPVCGLKLGSLYTVLIADHRLVSQALGRIELSGRAPLYVTHGIMQGYGLICADGDLWREQRRFAVGCLRNLGMVKLGMKKKIKMEARLQTAVDESIAKLTTRSNDGVGVDPHHTLLHCMGNVMNSIVFGKVFEEDDKTWKWLQSLQEDGVKHIGIAGPLNFLPFLRWLPRYKNMMRFLIDGKVKTHEIYAGISHEDNTECVLSAFDEEVERRRENGEPNGHFNQPQKMHLLADLFGAGTDTTLTTLRWLLLFLAVHPQEQKNIYDEITTVLKGKMIELEDRKVLPYLEAAIAETQRIRSVVPIGIPHGALEDSEIGGYLIPKGSMVVPLQWAIHMDPEYWENPDEFKPSRFISKDGSFAKRDNFLPFQSGKRVCLGIELAGMMLFIFAGRILQDCQISLPPDITVELSGDCGITLTPKTHRLIFTPRH